MTVEWVKKQLDTMETGRTLRISDTGLYAFKSNIDGSYRLAIGGVSGDLGLTQEYLNQPYRAAAKLESIPTRGVM